MRDLVIIGSGPAGLSAAVYAKRALLDVLVIEKMPMSGGQITNTEQVDNYLGLKGINGFDMGMQFRKHAEDMEVPFLEADVTKIEHVKDHNIVTLGNGETIETKTIVIATGAVRRLLGVEGEKELTGSGVSYCATCDGAFFRNKDVAVVGGGDVALEDALYLARGSSKVHLFHRRDEFRAAKVMAEQVLATENIEFHPFTEVKKIGGDAGALELTIYNNQTQENSICQVAGLFIAIGMSPVTSFVEGVVDLDQGGYVIAGEDGKTSVDSIFVAGDVRTKPVRQVATAVGDGASVIASVENYLNTHK